MRIGVLTFHRVFNPGAFFQCFATVNLLRGLGHEPVVIDYTNPKQRYSPISRLVKHPRLLLRLHDQIDDYNRNKAFSSCLKLLPLSARYCNHNQLSNAKFDSVLVGADIVWDYQNRGLGQDPIYFGAYLNTKSLIAFAPSCGAVDLTKPIPKYVVNGISLFSHISVRDANTSALVQNITGKCPRQIADPAISLELKISNSSEGEKVLLVYGHESTIHPSIRKKIRDFAATNNLVIESVIYRNRWVDKNYVGATPYQWLDKIRNAKYVFTTTFHGTVFSVLLCKQFVTFYNNAMSSKTKPFLELINQAERGLTEPDLIESIFQKAINYQNVIPILTELKLQQFDYLQSALRI